MTQSLKNPLHRGVNVIGDINSGTGLGEAARSLVQAMLKKAVPIHYTPFNYRADALSPVTDSGKYPLNLLLYNINAFRSLSPQQKQNMLQGRYTMAHWYWELATLNEPLKPLLDEVDEIWAPSRFCQKSMSTGKARVELIPPAVEVPISADVQRAQFGLPEDRFIFLFAFSVHSSFGRKNPFGLIKAFEKAFGNGRNHNAMLVLKAHYLDAQPLLQERLRKALARVGGHLIEASYTRQQVNDLLYCADAYVSLHRSEGFGLSLVESMYLGKPVIGTNYSANTDYMTQENSYPVDYVLRPLDEEDFAYYDSAKRLYMAEGQTWAEPSIEHAAILMRRVYDHPEEAQQKGQRAAQDIRRQYSLDAVGKRITERLREIDPTKQRARRIIDLSTQQAKSMNAPNSSAADNTLQESFHHWDITRTWETQGRISRYLSRIPVIGYGFRTFVRVRNLGRVWGAQMYLYQSFINQLAQQQQALHQIEDSLEKSNQQVNNQVHYQLSQLMLENIQLQGTLNDLREQLHQTNQQIQNLQGELRLTTGKLRLLSSVPAIPVPPPSPLMETFSSGALMRLIQQLERTLPGLAGTKVDISIGDVRAEELILEAAAYFGSRMGIGDVDVWYHVSSQSDWKNWAAFGRSHEYLKPGGSLVIITCDEPDAEMGAPHLLPAYQDVVELTNGHRVHLRVFTRRTSA